MSQTKNKIYYIYCHINKTNGKKYVGQTCKQPKQRWGHDGRGYEKRTLFFHAIKKYGWDNFEHEILTTCDSREEVNKLEKMYISILRSNNTYHWRYGDE